MDPFTMHQCLWILLKKTVMYSWRCQGYLVDRMREDLDARGDAWLSTSWENGLPNSTNVNVLRVTLDSSDVRTHHALTLASSAVRDGLRHEGEISG